MRDLRQAREADASDHPPHRDHRWDFPCCVWSTLPTCRRQYPGRSDGICSLVRFHPLRPSPKSGRVDSCISLFGACSAFTLVTACKLAESPMRPSTPKASAASLPPLLLRLLPGGANQFPGGYTPAVDLRLFTAHPITRHYQLRTHGQFVVSMAGAAYDAQVERLTRSSPSGGVH
jgi:hypothetical protein